MGSGHIARLGPTYPLDLVRSNQINECSLTYPERHPSTRTHARDDTTFGNLIGRTATLPLHRRTSASSSSGLVVGVYISLSLSSSSSASVFPPPMSCSARAPFACPPTSPLPISSRRWRLPFSSLCRRLSLYHPFTPAANVFSPSFPDSLLLLSDSSPPSSLCPSQPTTTHSHPTDSNSTGNNQTATPLDSNTLPYLLLPRLLVGSFIVAPLPTDSKPPLHPPPPSMLIVLLI